MDRLRLTGTPRLQAIVIAAVLVFAYSVVAAMGSRASVGARARVGSCRHESSGVVGKPRRPYLLHTSPPRAFISMFEVMRHRTTSADELPKGALVENGYSEIWIDYVRLLAVGPGRTRYFLVPGIAPSLTPTPCVVSSTDVHAPKESEASVSLDEFDGTEGLGPTRYTASVVRNGGAIVVKPGPTPSKSVIDGIVPDGVASVTVGASSGPAITATVANNLFVAEVEATARVTFTVRWRSSDGAIIKTIPLNTTTISFTSRLVR